MKVSGPFMVTIAEGDNPVIASHVSTALSCLLTGEPLTLLDISKAAAQLSLAARAVTTGVAAEPEWHNPEEISLSLLNQEKGWRFLVKGERPKEGDEFYADDQTWTSDDEIEYFIASWTYRTKRPLPQ